MKWKQILIGLTVFLIVFSMNADTEPREDTEDEQLICPQSPVEVAVGENLTVGCHLASQRNLTSEVLKLKLKSAFVLVSRDGDVEDAMQGKQFKGRASLDKSGLTQGNFSVTISSVNETDAGTYDCIVGTGTRNSCTFELSIVDQTKDKHPGTEHHKSENDRSGDAGSNIGAIIAGVVVVVAAAIVRRKKRGKISSCPGRCNRADVVDNQVDNPEAIRLNIMEDPNDRT